MVYNRNLSQHTILHRVTIIILIFISISLVDISDISDISSGYNTTPATNPLSVPTAAANVPGDTFVWERGNEKSATGYVKATFVSIENSTVFIDYLSYDIIGDLDINLTNKDGGFFWVDPAEFSDWLSKGYATENITRLGVDFECIIRVLVYSNEETNQYYDLETGILVESNSNLDNYINLIALEDIDVKQYVNDLGIGISFAPLGSLLLVSGLVIGMIFTRQQRLRNNH